MRNTVLIADDNRLILDILTIILEDDYTIITVENGIKAIDAIDAYHDNLCLILLDLRMPIMDGIDVLKYINKHKYIDDIPVLILSGDDSLSVEKQTLDLGAADFIKKPFDNAIIKRRIQNIIELYNYKHNLEEKVDEQVIQIKEQAKELKHNNLAIIDIIGTIVEFRNLESGEHIQRVKQYTNIIANKFKVMYPEYGLTDKSVEIITNASPLHDIGKISIPDSILLKSTSFTPDEYEIMKTHTIYGSEMIKSIQGAWTEEYGQISYNICRYHHERYDGNGYPDHLVGDDIPIEAQIVAAADVYDALINKRYYKEAIKKEKAITMIVKGECGAFSTKIINCLLSIQDKL